MSNNKYHSREKFFHYQYAVCKDETELLKNPARHNSTGHRRVHGSFQPLENFAKIEQIGTIWAF